MPTVNLSRPPAHNRSLTSGQHCANSSRNAASILSASVIICILETRCVVTDTDRSDGEPHDRLDPGVIAILYPLQPPREIGSVSRQFQELGNHAPAHSHLLEDLLA